MKKILIAAMLVLVPVTASASESDFVSVNSLMCSSSGACTAYFDEGSVAAGTQCERKSGNAVRWDGRTEEGRNMLSLMTAAHLSGKKVKVWDSGCYDSYPKLGFMQVF